LAEGAVLELAEALVAFANASGGHDNITVALARVGPLGENASVDAGATDTETVTEPGGGATADG
jgi:serine/threonine protein phosphatase PrpC